MSRDLVSHLSIVGILPMEQVVESESYMLSVFLFFPRVHQHISSVSPLTIGHEILTTPPGTAARMIGHDCPSIFSLRHKVRGADCSLDSLILT